MSAISIGRSLLRGLGWGIVASVLGNLVFGIFGLLVTFVVDISTYPIDISKEFSILPRDILTMFLFPLNLVLFGILFSLVPSAVGGATLGGLLQYLGPKAANPSYTGTVVGSLVGGAAGVVSSFFAIYLLLGGWVGGLVYLAILAWIIAFVAGGLVGRRLASAYR
jgi:hypothetical protein